jgi:signal transduction histidine kinase
VRDHGPGIPPAVHDRLFKTFDRISLHNTPKHGLGLSIASRIVEKLGGQVGMESEVGTGSLFFFTLPAAPSYREQDLAPIHAKAIMETSY